MSTHTVTTYGGDFKYTVVLDETGLVEVDGLSESSSTDLKYAIERYVKNGLSPIAALGKYVGPYSFVTDAETQDGLS